jgi:flagellar hook protein FlgE
MGQGSLLSTSSPTDLAIQGNGMFMLANPSTGISYSRDGHFAIDNSGHLVDATTGEFVLGWTADSTGKINTGQGISPTDSITIGIGKTTAVQPTSSIKFTGNLSADTPVGASAGTANQYSTSEVVYDSLGESHTINLTFTRQPDKNGNPTNNWNWVASGTGLSTPTAGTNESKSGAGDGTASVNEGVVSFGSNGLWSSTTSIDSSGAAVTGAGGPTISLASVTGSSTPQTITADFSPASQVAGVSTFAPEGQNGYASGSLSSFTIDQNGVITGAFSNGLTKALGQLSLAGFSNPQGLSQIGNNQYAPTVNSGAPLVGTANSLGLGAVSTGYLEQSNVDLGTELTNMIVAQRAFEANTKVVTAVDQMLNMLDQMKQ